MDGPSGGPVSIANTSVTIVDHCSGVGSGGDPSGQGRPVRAVIRLQCDRHNRTGNQCKAMNAMPVDSTLPKDRESQFSTTSSAGAGSGTSNGSGNASHRGRGRHRLEHKTSSRAELCATLPALSLTEPESQSQPAQSQSLTQTVPVSPKNHTHREQQSLTESAFDNKAFQTDPSDGQSTAQTRARSGVGGDQCKHELPLTARQRLFELSGNHSTNSSITDLLISNDNNIAHNSSKSDAKSRNFMKTNNESDSSLKGQQICSSGDTNCHVIRSRSNRSARSSVVKHIGVFYSDLCDVIKAMRSGTQSNSNFNNIANTNTSSTSSPPETNVPNQRNSLSAPVVLQNEHLIGSQRAESHQQSQPQQLQQSTQTQSPYPVQPHSPQSAITCLQSHPVSGTTNLRSPSQSHLRLNETHVPDLPDILNSHLPPPPYSTLPPSGIHPSLPSLPPLVERGRNTPIRAPPPPPPPPPLPVAGRPPLPSRRILHAPTAVLAHCSRPNYLRPTCAVSETETSASKACLSCNGLSIRWFILLIAFIGLLCAIIGTILGALRSTGREHLTLALLMIGVGIILITVSGIAWRLTSSGPTWRSILGLHDLHPQQSLCNGSSLNDTARRFVPRVPAPYGRTGTHHHPYGAMFYPEFQYRPPPPSYQASMQEYRLRLLLLDRSSHPPSTSLSPVSPPPTYRSSAASSLTGTLTRQSQCNTIQRAASRPPSYRAMTGQPLVSTTPSFQSSPIQSPQTGAPPLTTPTATTSPVSSTLTTSQSQLSPQLSNHVKCSTQKSLTELSHHDINRVTILQTTNTSQVCTPNGVNIVAISPTSAMANTQASVVSANEVQILAHV